MAPEDRRAALIAATVPLLLEFGLDVSTRQIAQAAGVAEGTIFGVFPDKASLILAALGTAFDQESVLRQLSAIDPQAPLRERMRDAAAILMRRFETNAQLMMVARTLPMEVGRRQVEQLMEGRRRLTETVAAIIEPDRALLRRSPAEVAQQLLFSIFATAGPFTRDQPLDAKELVSLLLDGVLIRTTTGDSPC